MFTNVSRLTLPIIGSSDSVASFMVPFASAFNVQCAIKNPRGGGLSAVKNDGALNIV